MLTKQIISNIIAGLVVILLALVVLGVLGSMVAWAWGWA